MSQSLSRGISTIDNPAYLSNIMRDVNIGYTQTSSNLLALNFQSINSMIENILTTIRGERVFEPEFGSDLPFLLQEPCDNFTAYRIETAVYDSLKRWMPYIELYLGNLRAIPVYDVGAFDVNITYTVSWSRIRGLFQSRFMQ